MKKVYDLAAKDVGTWEWKGSEHNPKVLEYFKDSGHDWVKDDETAWCAAFVGAMLKRSGLPNTGQLHARSYLNWGNPVEEKDAQLGDVVVFWRQDPDSWKGHVGFFDGYTPEGDVMVLGGNQRDQVNRSVYPRKQLLAVRRGKGAAESTEIRAAALGSATAATAAGASFLGGLRDNAQMLLVAAAIVAAACFAWMARKRILRLARGS